MSRPGNPRPTVGSLAALTALRAVTLADFHDYPRTTTNRDGRPYEAASINAYLSARAPHRGPGRKSRTQGRSSAS